MLTRREFAAGAVAFAAAEALAKGPTDRAAAIYARSFVLDCNSGADFGEKIPPKQSALDAVRGSGLTAIKETLGGATGSFESAVGEIALRMRDIEAAPDRILQVRRPADLDRAKREKKMGIIFSFESAAMLGSDVARIDTFRNLGVLVMQLTYNRTTPFGVGCLDGDAGGLTPLGRDAVKRMNAVGVAIDVSHANTHTTAEAIAASAKPVVITHAGCRAVYQHPRNKEDRELRALADRGGVIGIYMLPFLAPSPVQPTLAIYMRHMTHALEVCGEDHVGVGSDGPIERFDTPENMAAYRQDEENRKKAGVSAPGEDRPPYIPELDGPRKMERIAAALLKRGYRSRVVEKILGANFKRVFGEIWTS